MYLSATLYRILKSSIETAANTANMIQAPELSAVSEKKSLKNRKAISRPAVVMISIMALRGFKGILSLMISIKPTNEVRYTAIVETS